MSSPRHRFGNGSWNHDFVENTGECPPHFRGAYLKPAIQHALLEMTTPDKPQSRLQKYQRTPAGKTLAVAITLKK